jgi:hypothetical protein
VIAQLAILAGSSVIKGQRDELLLDVSDSAKFAATWAGALWYAP